ncbi:hypothetical protein MATL_G00008150 [Megalops atlanticus]|uniref:PHD-type domain-containing protein n=1 Tax=Megalops atlanticus TaxID=7932 RepID=A0A9D3TL34_MEGAT|nr:hypothetical protein MATL_G00008150 [Megalops atlanticus]
MQSFRERSGFRGNQHCHQQEPYELSRLENYRHHHSQNRQGYEAHSLAAVAAASAAAGTGAKDCYSQHAYPGYSSSSASAEKQYKGGKIPSQHLPGGYSSHLSTAYSTQYVSEGHLQQKWEDSSHLPQYEQNMLGRMESAGRAGGGGSQFLPQNMLSISQSQCSHASQASTPVYTSHHQQKLPQDTSPSPMTYTHGHLHFPQHSQSHSSSTPSYVEKCSPAPHCYKGYPMPPNSQYIRQSGSSNSLKQSSYRSQNSYTYQQPPSRTGYEQQASLQGMPNTQDSLSKYQHFSQPQQNYCLSDISVRSPEQYYQNCSPSSGHSPARSVGRSPSYSSAPSPLMVNSETFMYSQPPITSGASSSSSLREPGLHMPQQSHPSPGVNHQTTSYAGSLKDKFSEKLLSNPSLWSLNALTSQVENISNNVQQLLLSEALIANKKGSKRNNPKQGEDFKGQHHALEDSSCIDAQHAAPVPDAFCAPQTVDTELQDGGCSNGSEDQQERSYYYCSQNTSPAQATTNSHLPSLDLVSSCIMNSPNGMSNKSEDTVPSLQAAQADGNTLNTLLKSIREDKSPQSTVTPSSLNPEQNSPSDGQNLKSPVKENFEESAWSEKLVEAKEEVKEQLLTECDGKTEVTPSKQEEWEGDKKCPSLFQKISEVLTGKSDPSEKEEKMYQELVQEYGPADGNIAEKLCSPSDVNCKTDVDSDAQSEMYKSDFPTNSDTTGKRVPFVWRDEYLTMKEDNSQFPFLSSRSELFEERLSTATKEKLKALEEQHSVPSSQTTEVRSEKESLPSSDEVINNKIWSLESGEFFSSAEEERGNKSPANAEPEVQDAALGNSEKRPVICDITPLTNSAKTVFSVFNEEATPLSQSRDHIDRRDAVVLEPDSPQLPGKSIMHSAPSWADTPPSPKKGDEEINPGISCPSAVTPSTKSEPMAPSANLRAFSRKPARGRRRQSGMLMHTSVQIRRLSSLGGEEVPAAPQKTILEPSPSIVFSEQTGAAHKDISSQTPTLFAENFPSRMCTRSFTAMAAPKACLHLKSRRGPKPSKGAAGKDTQGDPKGLISKMKWRKQRGPKPAVIGHRKGRRGLSENRQQDENQETSLCSSPCVKSQKPMVLRSRKQMQEIPLKEKGKEKKTMCILPKTLKEVKKQRTAFLKDQSCASSKQNLSAVHRKGVYRTLISKSDKSVTPIKRKSSCHSPVTVKRQRGVKAGKPETLQPPLKPKLMGVKSPKKRLMQGEHFKIPLSSFLTKDPSPAKVTDSPCISPQYPAKTKYLPPRKGRGLKYEAMVQKITSPGSKKHITIPQVENIHGNLTTKSTLQDLEQQKSVKTEELKPEEGGNTHSIEEIQDTTTVKASIVRGRKRVCAEISDQPQVVSGAEALVINTPRLAKQRAIKNNHEMHLKQRRKRRKGLAPSECTGTAEQQEPLSASTPTGCTGEQIDSAQTPTDTSMCKKVKCTITPSKKRQATALGKPSSKKQKKVEKMGLKTRNIKHLHDAKPTKNGRRLKTRHRQENTPLVEGQQPAVRLKYVLYKPQKNENKPFSPYVHIDGSKEFASLCDIINRPEEELLLQARKKKCAKTQSPVIVAKAIPNSSVMLQGPLVNKDLTDRCLTCCLCGKTANYKELGDLCGPYYPEDSVPRKALSFKYKLESRDERVTVNCSAAQSGTLKREGVKSLSGGSSGRPGRPRKAERVSGESATVRPKFLERYKKLQQFQGCERRAGEEGATPFWVQDGSATLLQRLELEAEAKEHWVHEACAVWTSGVFLVAGKLYGLREAAHSAAEMSCSKCQDLGASISCCSKDCPQKFHYVCAKETGCLLVEESFSLKCTKHKAL